MTRRIVIAALVACLGLSAPAAADTVAQCGASAGHAFYFKAPLIQDGQTGWKRDSVSDGSITLTWNSGQWDTLIKDASTTWSSRAEGATVTVAEPPAGQRADGGRRLVAVTVNAATGVIEHYLFDLDRFGQGTVVWGTIRPSGPFPKSSLFAATCGWGR